jgi:hypothetical protein
LDHGLLRHVERGVDTSPSVEVAKPIPWLVVTLDHLNY